jgi:DNA-directed RNA polymerase subunit M/transcription elongation factor TFIIS
MTLLITMLNPICEQDSDVCPVCKGHMEPKMAGLNGEAKGQFRQTGSTRVFVCDKCGHKEVKEGLDEYVPVSDSVSAEKQEGSSKDNQSA